MQAKEINFPYPTRPLLLLDFFQATNFAAILCGVCHTLLKPFSKSGGGKKSKKRKEITEITVRKNLIWRRVTVNYWSVGSAAVPHLALHCEKDCGFCGRLSGNELPKGERDIKLSTLLQEQSPPNELTIYCKSWLTLSRCLIPGKIPVLLQRPRVLFNRQLQSVDLSHGELGKELRSGGPDVRHREPVLQAAKIRPKPPRPSDGDLLWLIAKRHCGQHPRELPRDVRHGARGGQEQDRVPRFAQVGVLNGEMDWVVRWDQLSWMRHLLALKRAEFISRNNCISHIANCAWSTMKYVPRAPSLGACNW